ncbi:MAG TPA: SDR family NAD(P)-dependent oxidoreductase, partial [Pirellulaceae bacterium]|nr:SDR family NAD(P)-dependent oxidoreductase [Pirellulaceae bacterium]
MTGAEHDGEQDAGLEASSRELPWLELSGRTAVVTGSSSGVGREIALELARAGADIVVHCRARKELAAQTADAIRALGRQAIVVVADLTDSTTLDPLVDITWQWRDGIDIWVNNAGADV